MVDFYFDYASPWSYLASEVLSSRLPGIQVVYRPIYLRGLELFAKGMPYSSAKLRYIGQDFLRCAEHEGVAVRMPTHFPVNGLYAVRGALAAKDASSFEVYHRALFHAAWRDDRDVGDKQVVLALAREVGLELEAAIDAPELKERLKRDTTAAEARGVFGVPSFFVGEELFWGHDRLDYVRRAAEKTRQGT
jgi:2-hydroxychromene-2-carboxylate isomerase